MGQNKLEKGANTISSSASLKGEPSSEKENRGNWTHQFDFFLSCLGYAVGLGNVWRFPYLCYKNGGGAFLVPYVIMLTLCGLPMFFLELSLGQYHGTGPNVLFKHMSPMFHGLGFGMLMVTFLVALYYNMIIAWTLFYTFASFTSQLGWEFCGNSWNTIDCFNKEQSDKCQSVNLTYWNNTCYEVEAYCNSITNFTYLNSTHCRNLTAGYSKTPFVSLYKARKRVSPSEDYYMNYMLNVSPSINEYGEMRWQLVLCLLLAWIIVALCLVKGVKSSGKVVYFTALFPYVVLFILLIRGATLDGAADGVYFYIVPKWEKLKDAQVWADAAVQIFYSLGPGFGGLLTLASYNRFNNNCYRDAVVIAISNCATSVFAGFVIFSILGFMAYTLDVPVSEVVMSGQGLAFIAYPEAVTKLPVSPLWAFLFFFMLITLGLDSQFTMCETLITALQDQWPSLRLHKTFVGLTTCGLCFILGLPLCAQGGIYLFTLIDQYSAGWSLLILAFLECIIVTWIYGLDRYKKNVEEMIGHPPNIYWTVTWKYISPIVMLAILIFSWVKYTPASFGGADLPVWANALGWLMAFSSVVIVPIFAVAEIRNAVINHLPISSLFKASKDWGPAPSSLSNDKNITDLPTYPRLPGGGTGSYDNPSFTTNSTKM